MLRLDRVTKRLGGFTLNEVSFEVEAGEYFILLGHSSAGKTVTLELIAGLRSPDSGAIYLDGRNVTRERIQERRAGLVHQDRCLFPHMSVRQNLAFGLRSRKLGRSRIRERVQDLARKVGVSDFLDRYPASLSGGEAQRVALARTLAIEPRCLLLDEPLSSLDAGARAEMRALLRSLHREGQTVVHVTHDFEEAVSLATRVAVIEAGEIVQVGAPQEVFQKPRNEFVARFVGVRNFFRGALTPAETGRDLARFDTNGISFAVLFSGPGGPGYLMLRGEDVTVSNGRTATSAHNVFAGKIVDIAPSRVGVEVTVDIGVRISSLVTSESVDRLDLACGKNAWVTFKASSPRFIAQD